MSDEKNLEEGSYVDAKGRTRWHENDKISLRLLELHTFLIIADYPEDPRDAIIHGWHIISLDFRNQCRI